MIEGEVRQADGNTGSHAWNTIKIDGSWHYYDSTFDLTLIRVIRAKTLYALITFAWITTK